MTTTIEPSRSSLEMENLQELIDAESSAASVTNGYAQQYITPTDFAYRCAHRLGMSPRTVVDPQVGTGALLQYYDYSVKFGIDIDTRLPSNSQTLGPHIVSGNCVKVWEIIDDLFPHLLFDCANANPPFGRRWKNGDQTIDSTKATWDWVTTHARYGYFIANYDTVIKLGILKHPFVTDHTLHNASTIWSGVRDDLQVCVVYWKNPDYRRITEPSEAQSTWRMIQQIFDEERIKRPPFNIYLNEAGLLRTHLSTRFQLKQRLTRSEIVRLATIDNAHPLSLCVEVHTRRLLEDLITAGAYTIQPEARKAIDDALIETEKCAVPIMPCTNFESVAYADNLDHLTCKVTTRDDELPFTKGRKYRVTTDNYKFSQTFKRTKVHFSEQTGTTYTAEHEVILSGQDRFIGITDDRDRLRRFMDRPTERWDFDERRLWDIFEKPEVKTVFETARAQVDHNLAILRSCEMIAGYTYYPGQLGYLARVAVKNAALLGATTGAGKSLMALSLLAMKGPNRALIIAPQGTMRSPESDDDEDATDYNASQWITEIQKFTPYMQIWELFSEADYERICSLNGGQLPPGVYVTYYQAFFQNGARETAAQSWDDKKLNQHVAANFGLPPLEPMGLGEEADKTFWTKTVGEERNGIRCIISPCLATRIGHLFDMVLADEAHLVTNLDATVTQMLIRLQPRYRYALTATPIPNIVSNLFSLAGWLSVPDWYKGKRRNAAWPYAREELARFNQTFLSVERDLTQEEMNRRADPKWGGKCLRTSPIISAPSRLLKLLKPFMAYISKEECNPDYQPAKIVDVRVPMGLEQSKLYAHFLNRGNIPAKNALVRARKQTAYLRNICADPAGFRHGGPRVSSNMNPKLATGLELIRTILEQGEQVVCICARVGQSDTLQHRLTEAGVPIARIDSTISPDQHSQQANLFKSGKARVMLMGIKCAAAHSFSNCIYEIIFSIEYSHGPFHQAQGRVDRVNSRPGVTIYCILHKHSYEELMFDLVATKGDAATICLKGMRVPRDFHPVDASEILARNIIEFDASGAVPESDCNKQWPKLREAISRTLTLPANRIS